VQELAPNIFVEMSFRLVNVGAILTDDGFVLIDTPPYPEDARYWRDQLAAVATKPILAIINTDGHRDRIFGNGWFNPNVVVAHDETIVQLKNVPNTFIESTIDALTHNALGRNSFAGIQLSLPTVGFTHKMQLRYGNWSIPLLGMAGPSTGSLWVHLPEQRILFVGDSVITDQHPFITSSCTKTWLENLSVLRRARFAADYIVPGRGPIVGKSATEPISNYLRVARRRVQSLYRLGRPRADTTTLVPELLELFPYDENDLDQVQRRIKAGLDRIYEEFKVLDKENDEPLEE
jgi:cyclase